MTHNGAVTTEESTTVTAARGDQPGGHTWGPITTGGCRNHCVGTARAGAAEGDR
jgi:hypothetical protein